MSVFVLKFDLRIKVVALIKIMFVCRFEKQYRNDVRYFTAAIMNSSAGFVERQSWGFDSNHKKSY